MQIDLRNVEKGHRIVAIPALLYRTDIRVSGDTVSVIPRKWSLSGCFRTAESKIPCDEKTSALFYINTGRDGAAAPTDRRIVGVDALYQNLDTLHRVRVFGSEVDVSSAPAYALFQNHTVIELDKPRGMFELTVKKVNEQLLFKIGDVFFNHLQATKFFDSGSLTVFRNGKMFDETKRIGPMRNQSTRRAFIGFSRLLSGERRRDGSDFPGLEPEMFLEGDTLRLNILRAEEFDFENHLRNEALDSETVIVPGTETDREPKSAEILYSFHCSDEVQILASV